VSMVPFVGSDALRMNETCKNKGSVPDSPQALRSEASETLVGPKNFVG
jgi:hypothetical protein